MKTIVIANHKGGQAKTTTALALAGYLNKMGHKTLLIDADPGRDASGFFGAKLDGVRTVCDMIGPKEKRVDPNECIQHTENGDIIVSNLHINSIIGAEKSSKYFMLRSAIKKIKGYEYIVIDTEGSYTDALYSAIIAADYVIITNEVAGKAVNGTGELLDVIEETRDESGYDIRTLGVLIGRYGGRTNLDKEALTLYEDLCEEYGVPLFNTKIRECVKVREAQLVNESLLTYAPNCTSAEDYGEFTKEVLDRVARMESGGEQ